LYGVLGCIGWTPEYCKTLQYKDIIYAYDGFLLHEWDKHSQTIYCLEKLGCIVMNLAGARAKPRDVYEYHPYRQSQRQGKKVTDKKSFINTLKMVVRK
jgi:hypothetical protein